MEGLEEVVQEILEIAALTHDIGIKISEAKYHSSGGQYQQIEGPPEARKMLEALAVREDIIERVCWLIAHHHTYHNIDAMDYQILVEADFLVNIFEDGMPLESIKGIREKIFKTPSGIFILDALYPGPEKGRMIDFEK
ncbi:HD domain-containing protein [Lachnospiraceae bacterium 54-53]